MIQICLAALTVTSSAYTTPTLEVVSIQSERVFAGKLGYRVRETLNLRRDGKNYSVRIDGQAHTITLHGAFKLHEGDLVMISEAALSRGSVKREMIRKVR